MRLSPPHAERRGAGLLLLLLFGALAAGGCSLNSKPVQPAVMSRTNVTAPVEALRSVVLGRSQQAANELERAADTIAAVTDSTPVRINTLQWKLVSSTAIQSAALARDPTVALADLIMFLLQMQTYLTTGPGRDLFGAEQPVAVQAVERSLARLLDLVDEIAPAGASGRWLAVLEPLAAAHPIRSPLVGRTSVADTVLQQLSTDRSALAAVGDIELTVRLLDQRVDQIQRNLLKQARWQAELLLASAGSQPVVDTLVRSLTSVTASVDRMAEVAEGVPFLVTSERLAVLRAVTAEREALLAALSIERDSILARVTAERIATLADAEAAAGRLVDHAMDGALIDLVDRILWRIFAGLAILGLLGLAAGVVLVRAMRSPPPPAPLRPAA
ncbi:MAG TPA: hypothetical protein VFV65_06305 [Gemmatimonadales bacterium]|nr:hypothetical protein [Gemmatimonadales bacterium]